MENQPANLSQPQGFMEQGPHTETVRLGIVGCGYVTRMSHLPASIFVDQIQLTTLVDNQINIAKDLAKTYHVPSYTSDYQDIYNSVDAVIIALPHHLHAPVALDFLSRGIHVLVEKPMALNVEECNQMIAVAEEGHAKLAVGHMRRFYVSNRLIKRFIDTQFLGVIQRFEAEEAVLFNNFNASPFTVFPPSGGVLFDTGAHVIDLLQWWLGDFQNISYWDDARGGVEANCRLEVTTEKGIPGVVELSRVRHLKNRIRLFCQDGMLEVATLHPSEVIIHSDSFSGPIQTMRIPGANVAEGLVPYFADQLKNFASAILSGNELYVPGIDGMKVVATIQQCKNLHKPLPQMPWETIHIQSIWGNGI